MQDNIIAAVRLDLQGLVDDKTRDNYRRFFKEDVTFYGVKNNIVNRLAGKYYREIKSLSKNEIFRLCEELLKSDYGEEAFVAFDWSYRLRGKYAPEDFAVFDNWLHKYVNNWAKCDTLCNHTVGAFIEKFPRFISELKEWACSKNRWLRRAAAVSLIVPVKKGKFLDDVFEISGILLTDADDLVRKGYGWLLKDASIKHRTEVFDYVMKHKQVMPRTALRYAIERMSPELRRQAMAR
jgi:3-methyladenine DNA glycosylase AlkD